MLHRLSLLLLLLCSAIVAPDTLKVYKMKAWRLQRFVLGNVDRYVKVFHNNRHFGTTQVNYDTANPVWTDSFRYRRATLGSLLKLVVYDKDVPLDNWVGYCMPIIMRGNYQHTCNLYIGGDLEYRYILQ